MNILFHIPELSRVTPCLNNVRNYLKAVDTNADKLWIVFNGDAVNSLVSNTASADQWKDLAEEHANIQLDVCSNSLRGMGIIPESLIQPVPAPADSNPRITWGRWHRQEGRTLLPMTLLANHALVDGIHIARFYENLDQELAALCGGEKTEY